MPKPVLLIVDAQNDYFSGGSMALPAMEAAAGNIAGLLAHFRETGLPVVHIFHEAVNDGATFFLKDTLGVQIHASVAPLPGELQIKKHFPNAFRQTQLLEQLQAMEAHQLVICGAMTNMCIDATTRAATDHGFACTVIADACAARPVEFDGVQVTAAQVHAAFLANLAAAYAKVETADRFLMPSG
ncbi:MAG: cysteine hydrolase family protein [Desulfosarcinaceae bacterium]